MVMSLATGNWIQSHLVYSGQAPHYLGLALLDLCMCHYVNQAGLELAELHLPLVLQHWDQKRAPPAPDVLPTLHCQPSSPQADSFDFQAFVG